MLVSESEFNRFDGMITLQKRRIVATLVFLAAFALLLLVFRTQSVTGDSTSLQSRVNTIGAQLRAPSDHNSMTVAISPIPQAEHIRYQIQEDIMRGMSDRQILNAMVKEYGPGVLAAPRMTGFGLFVWLLPLLCCLAFLLIWGTYLLKNRIPRVTSTASAKPIENEVTLDALKDYL